MTHPGVVLLGAVAERLSAGWRLHPPDAAGLIVAKRARVVVVLDEGLTGLEPVEVLRRVPASRLVLCPLAAPHEVVAAWVRLGAVRVTSRATLATVVAGLLGAGTRVIEPLPLEDWWPDVPQPGSAAWDLLLAVGLLRCPHSVTEWGRRLGLPRQKLYELCRSELGASPAHVLGAYVAAQVGYCRDRGLSWRAIAPALGYHDAAGLLRALRRHEGPLAAPSVGSRNWPP